MGILVPLSYVSGDACLDFTGIVDPFTLMLHRLDSWIRRICLWCNISLATSILPNPAVCYFWEGVQSFYIVPIRVLHFNYENFSGTALDIIYDFSMVIIIPF